ncbi:MAG TPA: response regulator [Candidatus Eisenbacteria bacterium]|nr:response regulator [Candidatus Eisenbacteria bacterium]
MIILSISLDAELLQLRQTVLRAAGHEVINVASEKDAALAAQSPNGYDVALLCHRFPAAAARQTVRLLRQNHSGTRIVYIVHVYGEWPEVEADRYIVGADGPDALVRVLDEVHA